MAGFMERFSPHTAERMRSVLARAREVSETVTETVEVAGTAFAFAWAEGRYGESKTTFFADKNSDGTMVEGTGVPASLLVGLAAHVIIFSGMDAGYAKHIRNVGDGALAHYAVKAGTKLGQKMADQAAANPEGDPYTGPEISPEQNQATADEIRRHRQVMADLRKNAHAQAT